MPIFCYIKYASFLFFSNINLNTKHLEIFTSDNGMSRGGGYKNLSIPSSTSTGELRGVGNYIPIWDNGSFSEIWLECCDWMYSGGWTYKEMSSEADKNANFSVWGEVTVLFLSYLWNPVYLSRDKNNNVILTLWLNDNYGDVNNDQSYYTGRPFVWQTDHGENHACHSVDTHFYFGYRGYAYCPLSYSKSLNKYGVISADSYSSPSNLYKYSTPSGNSSFATYTHEYYENYDSTNLNHDYNQKYTNIVNLSERDPDVLEYLVKPRDVAWQEVQSAKEILGIQYNLSNESWSTSLSDDGFYSPENNYAHISGSDSWADEYFWLPSLSEIGYSGSSGLWGVSAAIRACSNEYILDVFTDAYVFDAYKTVWTRSANYKQSHGYYFIKSNGEGKGVGTIGARIFRPAVHINLTAINARWPGGR